MSSHREAPEISKDPVADNADVYAFVSPDSPSMVTIISNFVPLQGPAGGPNFYEFGDDVLYSIYIDNDGDAQPEIEYQFQFNSTLRYNNTFLYNIGTINSLDDPEGHWNARQFYSVTRIDPGPNPPRHGPPAPPGPPGPPGGPPSQPGPAWGPGPTHTTVLATNLPCPPCNIGPASTPSYEANLGHPAVKSLPGGGSVFAGQRSDPFYVDLGGVFDLADLRPFQGAFLGGVLGSGTNGVDATKALNIHSIAIQIPISMLTRDGSVPTTMSDPKAVLGIWSAASRRKMRMFDDHQGTVESGPWFQVSRLGNPLFNEVVVPIAEKDDWNRGNPAGDSEYLPLVQNPELSNKIANVLYTSAFTHLAGYSKPRNDLVAILLTGIPTLNASTVGPPPIYADMLRLNVAVPPTSLANASVLGVLGNDPAGYPNGRRVFDDVVAIDLRAFAGATIPLVDSGYTPDGAAGLLSQWSVGNGQEPPPSAPLPTAALDSTRYLNHFPYVGTPYPGYSTPSS